MSVSSDIRNAAGAVFAQMVNDSEVSTPCESTCARRGARFGRHVNACFIAIGPPSSRIGGASGSDRGRGRLPDVLAAQGGTIEGQHVLRSLIVVMAGDDEFDPYQD